MATANFPAGSTELQVQVTSHPVGHLPLVRAVVDQLGIMDVIDELCPPDPRSVVSDGECVLVMLLNVLAGRVALYNMEAWLERTDVELLLGYGVEAGAFNDTRMAQCLDHIAKVGTELLMSRVAGAYLKRPESPRSYSLHQDTTSISLYGAYENEAYRALPARGFSKDHRPDLKQLVFGLTLHGSNGIPLVGTMFSGNTSDSVANRFHVEALAELLPAEDDVTLIGDCKLVDAKTMGELIVQNFHFVSLVPKTFQLRSALVEELRASGEAMPELARTPGRTKSDTPRVYRGHSRVRTTTVGWQTPGDNHTRQVELRYLVVESSQLEEEEQAMLDRQLAHERATFDKALAALEKRTYSCEQDAKQALEKVTEKLRFHAAAVDVIESEATLKRKQRGRPPAGEVQPTTKVYMLKEREPLAPVTAELDKLRFHNRHFVLITDHLDEEAWPDARILAEYRQQNMIEGTTGFRWLKNIAAVAPIFLHTPRRIAALGVVMLLALMVRNYIQYELRRRLVEEAATVPDRLHKPTTKPTTETAMIPFAALATVHLVVDGRPRGRQSTTLPEAAQTVLRMLRITEDVFRTPPRRKFQPAQRETPEM